MLPNTPDELPEGPLSLGDILDSMGLSYPTADSEAVYNLLEAGVSLSVVLDWHIRENLRPAMPQGSYTASKALTAVLNMHPDKSLHCPCGECDGLIPASHAADVLFLHPFVRFIAAHN